MDLVVGAIGTILLAVVIFGWGLFAKNKQDKKDARQFIILAALAFLALWIYGSNRPQ